jgi:hypothetical protein
MRARNSLVRGLPLAVLVAAVPGIACATPQAAGHAPQPTVRTVAQDPGAWLDKDVELRGTLENRGTNAFTDLRVVLRDDQGHAVTVKPWLPVSVPPGPRPGGPRPKTLSSYLGKTVDLKATVRRGELRGAGATYYLEVKQARLPD